MLANGRGFPEKDELPGRSCDLRRGPYIQQTTEGDCRLQILDGRFKNLFERRFWSGIPGVEICNLELLS